MVRVSMRSKTPLLDVSAICGRYGGGGHQLAAGARIRGELGEVEARVLAHVREEIVRHQFPIVKPKRRDRIPLRMMPQSQQQGPDGVLLVDKAP